MRFRTHLLVAAVALAGCAGPTAAQTPPPDLVWMVLNEINTANFNRAEPLNHPPFVTEVPEGMLTAVDVSHDGKPDWLVNYDSQGMQWCGTGGCLQTLYVSHGDDLVMAFNQQALEPISIATVAGETRVTAWVHHGYCVPDNWECRFTYGWNAGTLKLVLISTTSESPSEEVSFQPIDPDET